MRVLVAVVAALAMIASSGLSVVPAEAQGSSTYVFQGAGWGHGVGMSQNGARNMANAGIEHVGILNHYYPNTIVSQVGSLGNIRVHIGDAGRVEMSSAGSLVFEKGGVAINSIPSGTITVSAHDGGLQIGNAWTTGTPADPVYVSFPQPVKISNNGHRYLWGKLQLTNRNGKVRVVEDLPMEQYVAGIAEMPAAWPLEALMAQAIAARTYAHEVTLHRRNSDEWAQEYDISGTTVDQNYIGYDAQDSAWDQKWLAAVSATADVEIVDSNGPIRAYYSATNGGYTETADYVFSNNVPYTVAGPDPYDEGGHDWTTWTRTYSQEAMSRWLNRSTDTSVGTLTSIEVLDGAGASARIDKAVVEIIGTAGTKRVTGKRLMLVINAGVFGEGGGLSTHLPGTYTTIGNGAGAGAPQPSGVQAPATVTPDPIPEGTDENSDFVPPPGWEPEPGTGVPPGTPSAPLDEEEAAGLLPDDTADGDGYVPPEGWTPEPGTGVPPGVGVPPGTPTEPGASNATDGAGTADGESFVPPEGWTPEEGTGVPPGTPTEPGEATPSSSETSSSGTTSADIDLPEGWTPEPGTGVPPGTPTEPTGGGDTETVGGTGGGLALAPGVMLVTRTADATEISEATFEVIAPNDELAAEARARLKELQTNAALGLFANIDIDGYVAAVAPRPVHAVCKATDDGVVCVPLASLRAAATAADDNNDSNDG